MPRHTTHYAIAAVFTASLAACGGGFRPGAAFQPNEARFFDDGIDIMRDPSKLGGQWSVSYGREFDARVSLSDLVAVVEVVSVQTNRDIDGLEAKRITVAVVEEIFGMSPARNLLLRSLPEALGYTLIERHEGQLSGRFVAFIRFFEGEDGALAKHFHLSPASKPVLEATRARVAARMAEESSSKER